MATLASDLAAALDPVILARNIGLTPDPWQTNVLRSSASRILLNCSRQSGKSTVSALLALHEALFQPRALVLLLSPSLRQSAELFRVVARSYTATGAVIPPKAESALRLELENGSRVVSLPASEATVRGFAAVDLLVVDEASRVQDDLYFSILPMLAVSNGRLVALSTPFGRRGWWSEAWHGSAPWDRYEVPATMCPRIPREFLEEQRQSMGDWWFQQEFMCRFLDSQTQAFSTEDIHSAFVKGVTQWNL